MSLYRKQPVIIDAKEWKGGEDAAKVIITWAWERGGAIAYRKGEWVYVGLHDTPNGPSTEKWVEEHLLIDTLEGKMVASVGDFIICGVKNEFYPCKPDIFWQTYEEL